MIGRFSPLSGALLLLLAVASCAPRPRLVRFEPTVLPDKPGRPRERLCGNWQAYVPDTSRPSHTSVRTLRINFHVVNSLDSSHNFRPDSGRIFLRRLLEYANKQLDTNINNWRSPEKTPVLPKGYRYQLCPQPGDDGIYFHYDDSLYYFVSQGKNQNNYNRRVIDKYGIGLDSIINVFMLVHPDDSIRSSTYRSTSQGIALGAGVKLAGVYEKREPPENFPGLLNHEVGHILGLSHAWTEDGCPDTDNHPNKCWCWGPDPPCRDQASNNTMDYNAYQVALTPCQLGRIHATLSNERHYARRCLIPTWCSPRPGADVVIRDSVAWNGARDLEGNLTVAPGGRLYLSCRLSLPEGCRIVVQPGGKLYLDSARLHNACGRTWNGVFVEKMGKSSGEVIEIKPAVWENLLPLKNNKPHR